MPGLTADADSSPSRQSRPQTPHSTDPSRSSSPTRPPYSPITPVLGPARLATIPGAASTSPTYQRGSPQRSYTHSQASQTFISQPPPLPDPISLEDNPDAIALRSAISILQVQRQNAISDLKTLQEIKGRAAKDPDAFVTALLQGDVRTRPDPLFHPGAFDDEREEDGEDDETGESARDSAQRDKVDVSVSDASRKRKWPYLPTPQNVVRAPPINWAQYGVVGDSLEKIHADQVARPMEGQPAKATPDGRVVNVEGGQRKEFLGVAAPYTIGKDSLEKGGSKKGGKR
ncbi:MAG: hypothetical protein M1818_008260 [Claussenomyces sp. TS43310]|nr:MAG: hypothetical protein M1818_008260 [Claussenomyces sp. TS43310]